MKTAYSRSGWKAGTNVTVSQNKYREGNLVQRPCLIFLWAPMVWPKALERKKKIFNEGVKNGRKCCWAAVKNDEVWKVSSMRSEYVRLFFADGMIVYVKNPKYFTKKLLE